MQRLHEDCVLPEFFSITFRQRVLDSEEDTQTGNVPSTLEVVPEEPDVTGTAASPPSPHCGSSQMKLNILFTIQTYTAFFFFYGKSFWSVSFYSRGCVCTEVTLPCTWEQGYPPGPAMETYKLQLQTFTQEWNSLDSAITCSYITLDIANQTPQTLLREMVDQMERMWPFSSLNLNLATLKASSCQVCVWRISACAP